MKNEPLQAEVIRSALPKVYQDCEIVICQVTDSTNRDVKVRAAQGAKEGLVVLAEEQTAGRGRCGRGFVSPAGTGIYMSMLFHPTPEQAAEVVLVTTAASVAVCRAIRDVLHKEPSIKWVNDILLNDKKVSGILTEAVSGTETGRVDTVVVGIGINCCKPAGGFPKELENIAGALWDDRELVSRNHLVAAIIKELRNLYEHLSDKTYMEEYRRWSAVLGKEVRFSVSDGWRCGTAMDIDEDGGLVVRMEDGTSEVLRTGEISLRICE